MAASLENVMRACFEFEPECNVSIEGRGPVSGMNPGTYSWNDNGGCIRISVDGTLHPKIRNGSDTVNYVEGLHNWSRDTGIYAPFSIYEDCEQDLLSWSIDACSGSSSSEVPEQTNRNMQSLEDLIRNWDGVLPNTQIGICGKGRATGLPSGVFHSYFNSTVEITINASIPDFPTVTHIDDLHDWSHTTGCYTGFDISFNGGSGVVYSAWDDEHCRPQHFPGGGPWNIDPVDRDSANESDESENEYEDELTTETKSCE